MNTINQKKFWIALVAVIVLLITTVPMIFAESSTIPTLTVAFTDKEGNALTSVHTGDDIYITASATIYQDEMKLYALDYSVFFDSDQVEIPEGTDLLSTDIINTDTDAPLNSTSVYLNNSTADNLLLSAISTSGFKGNGILYQVPVTVKDTATGTLKLEQKVTSATVQESSSSSSILATTSPAIDTQDTSTSNQVTVIPALSSISAPDQTLDPNEDYTPSVVTATYVDESTKTILADQVTFTPASIDTTDSTIWGTTIPVTASYTENNITKECTFNVEIKALTSISVPEDTLNIPQSGVYTPQEVTATYSDGTSKEVTATFDPETIDTSVVGKTTVNVSYEEDSIKATTSYVVNVYAFVDKIEADDVSLKVGDDYTAPTVKATYTDGSIKNNVTASFDPATVDTDKDNTDSPETVTASYTDEYGNTVETTFTVTVEKELASISVPRASLSVPLNGDYTPQAVTATYTDESTAVIAADQVTFTDVDLTKTGTTSVTVSYQEAGIIKTTSYDVTVYTGVSKIEAPDVSLKVGETYEAPVVTATYTDGSTADVTADTNFDPATVDTDKDNTDSPETVTASYTDEYGNTVETTFTVTVEKELASISVPEDSLNIAQDATYTAQKVTATYTDGSTAEVTATFDPETIDTSVVGKTTVNVSYEEDSIKVTTSYVVNVYAFVEKIEAPDVSLKVGETYEAPIVTATDSNGDTKTVTASFDPATVDTTKDNTDNPETVTASYTDEYGNTVETTFTVTVEKELVSISVPEDSLNIAQDATYTAQKVTATYTDGSTAEVTATFDPETIDTSVVGKTTVNVSYEEDSIKVTTSYVVNVYAFVEKIEAPDVSLKVGETYEAPVVTATYTDGTTTDVTVDTSFDPATVDTDKDNTDSPETVTASYTDEYGNIVETTFTVTVEKELASISVPEDNVYYTVDETFVPQTVTASYTDGTEEVVNATMTSATPDMSQVGTTEITFSYTYDEAEKTTTYNVIVANKVMMDQTVSQTIKQGETPELDGQVFTGVLVDQDGDPILDEETGEEKVFEITYDSSQNMEILNFDSSAVGTKTYDIVGIDENGDAFILKDAVEITVESTEEISSDTTDSDSTETTTTETTTTETSNSNQADNANTGVEETSNTPIIIALIIIALLAIGFLIYRRQKHNKK